eukprot:6186902-Pleurochrysis_carterae.AAC.2
MIDCSSNCTCVHRTAHNIARRNLIAGLASNVPEGRLDAGMAYIPPRCALTSFQQPVIYEAAFRAIFAALMVSLRSACFPLFATRPPLSLRRGHDEYEGWNATGWESTWLSHIWRSVPSSPAEFPQWLDGYMLNTKLDPDIHQSPLTVRTPTAEEVVHARAIGFKVRPATIASNHLAGAQPLARLQRW